jgi:hypothetical protein
VTKPTGVGRGGARAGAGRPRKQLPPPPHVVVDPEVVRALEGIQRTLERLQQQRHDGNEHGPLILRRLTEIERLVRGDPGLTKPPRHTRGRPLGVE